jgi:L-aspartate oxidase
VLAVPGAPRYLLSEALRGEGARLVNEAGEPFMTRYEPEGDLASRDRVSRAMLRESARTGAPVYLSLAHLPADVVRERFPVIADLCRRVGLDLATDRLPVSPAAHYAMGGVATDLDGRTSLPGLFAAGEAACTGVHGANRLASNSLLEGLVFGGRAGRAMQSAATDAWPAPVTRAIPAPAPSGSTPVSIGISEAALRDLMWTEAAVFRDRAGLQHAADALAPLRAEFEDALAKGAGLTPETWRLGSLLTVGSLVVAAALRREESRGAHWRTDFPAREDRWKRHTSLTRGREDREG